MNGVVVIIAKDPVPGRVKTRLCPPWAPEQAAALARAALLDTIEVASASAARQVLVALDGPVRDWLPSDVCVVAQRGDDLGERLAGVFDDVGGPGLVVGMDTPQLTVDDVDSALVALDDDACDAVLGPALDGGYWAIGLCRPDRRAFIGVPMSRHDTGSRQRAALDRLGLRVRMLRTLRDVDHHDDALAVAAEAPTTRFARVVRAVSAGRAERPGPDPTPGRCG
ncbi:MAG: TIGR04282 family arsenosugar biosynthesis glycosyltransferase [Microthrixaceae bacterium]|nr:TIGR04282 family arsenosugar biosynthesis glycosyltransferase [Microthrixaceae bacterium]